MNEMVFIWIIYAMWLALGLYLIVTVIGSNQTIAAYIRERRGLATAIIAAAILPHVPPFQLVNFAPLSPELSVFGLIICELGMAFLVAAQQNLIGSWRETAANQQRHKLVTSGPYALLRHPMYAGGLVAALGSAITAGGPFVFLLIFLGLIFRSRVGAEDALMAREFPDKFPDYRQRTNALIPFVW